VNGQAGIAVEHESLREGSVLDKPHPNPGAVLFTINNRVSAAKHAGSRALVFSVRTQPPRRRRCSLVVSPVRCTFGDAIGFGCVVRSIRGYPAERPTRGVAMFDHIHEPAS
jgi:hypothetical protein